MGACTCVTQNKKQEIQVETDKKNKQIKKTIKQTQMVDNEPNEHDIIVAAMDEKTGDESEQTLNELVTRRRINECIQQKKETKQSYEWSDIQKQLNINDNDPDIDKYKKMYAEEKNKPQIVYNKSNELKDIIAENWKEKKDEPKIEPNECTVAETGQYSTKDDDKCFMKECKFFTRMKDAMDRYHSALNNNKLNNLSDNISRVNDSNDYNHQNLFNDFCHVKFNHIDQQNNKIRNHNHQTRELICIKKENHQHEENCY
eukprot:210913_1